MKVVVGRTFEREAKRLIKKYHSLPSEIADLIESLENNPELGTPIGKNCFKIRLAIQSKGQGKRGGARVISCVLAIKEEVVLLSIYDKAEKEDISNLMLQQLLEAIQK
ncbi:MAG TPA: type II toxin-antitoxin system RelE/ParE family toxin [Catalimonadaceae bacterium]|nr:type II toxin-antitoxin system RelE/ParE family toxin [Catalimonadaceae bacterium]